MFSKEFFPTPVHVIEQMGINCYNKVVLEPSAGKGDIVDWLKANGAKDVICCEINDDLRKIVEHKARVISSDFFKVTAEHVSHIQQIVMNPPFSNADKHILHAWEIAPEGCEIISLCNWETIRNGYSSSRRELENIISDYGDDSINLGKCFDTAERTTNVEVGLIRLFKPALSSNFDFEGFYTELDNEPQENGIMQYNEIRAIVNSYIGAVACFDEVEALQDKIKRYTDVVGFGTGDRGLGFEISYNNHVRGKAEFAKALQKSCWHYIFGKLNLQRFVTSGVQRDINRFVETQTKYPFTMRNVYKMFDIIVGTRENTMNRAIEEAIDNITRHTHENRFAVEGWKTNSGHMLNKKFIIDWICEVSYRGGIDLKYSSNESKIDDLMKAICYLEGMNYDKITNLRGFFNMWRDRRIETNRWYTLGFFEFKCFKKGTMHFKFTDDDVWANLNKAYAKIKGQVLPETTWKKATDKPEGETEEEEVPQTQLLLEVPILRLF